MIEKEIIWQANEHEHGTKAHDWFWVLGILAVASSVVSILFQNYFFAILVLVAAFTLALLARRAKKSVKITINKNGLVIGPETHKWSTLQAFWIETTKDDSLLLIDTTKILTPHLLIPIPKYREQEIRSLLAENIKEEELQQPASNRILEWLGL